MQLVKYHTAVPEDILAPARNEINQIDWDKVSDMRSKNAAFTTSRSVGIRIHAPPLDKPAPTTVNEWSMIVECKDHPINAPKFPATYALANWIFEQVGGLVLGRIMITNLLPRGIVPLHTDPLDYFAAHSRFHVPIKTNKNVVFSGGDGTEYEHMPQGHLSQLNNRLPHMLENKSNEYRIHLIVDIQVPGGNQVCN